MNAAFAMGELVSVHLSIRMFAKQIGKLEVISYSKLTVDQFSLVSVKRVYTIPKGAYNVAIREENSNSYYTGHFLGLKDARGTFLIRGEYVTKPGVFRTEHNVVHGNTLWKYQNVHTQDILETKGPTTEAYTLSMKLTEARKTYNIKITYALKGQAIKPPEPPSRNNQWNYQWKHMTPKRGKCSVECGNGYKVCRIY